MRKLGRAQFLQLLAAAVRSQKLELVITEERIRLKVKGKEFCYCPITAVAKARTGMKYDINRWVAAAKSFNLSLDEAKAIVAAADSNNESSHEQASLRRKIKAACA